MQSTSVYKYFDGAGTLIYVGVTGRRTTRQHEHARDKDWWSLVATQEVTHFPTRAEALAHESELIARFSPPFNIQQNNVHADIKGEYLRRRETLSGQSPFDLVRKYEKSLPSRVLRESDGRVAVSLLEEVASVPLAMPRSGLPRVIANTSTVVGRVVGAKSRGLFSVLEADVRRGIQAEYALVRVKIDMQKGGLETYIVRSVLLAGGLNNG